MQGIMICGHGSRAKEAEQEFSLLATGLKQRYPDMPIEYGFLEYSAPNIHMGLDALIKQGVTEIFAVPGMLFAATHAKNDIPSVLTTYEEKHPGLTIHYGPELGLQEGMIEAFQERILQSIGLTDPPKPGELYDTMLVVVGRGTSDTWANAEATKLTRIVNENLGFGWADTVYSGVTYPSVGVGLERLVKLGYKKIVVAPYFLFTGLLIDRIHRLTDEVAAANPDVEFIMAPYLKDHPKVLGSFQCHIDELMSPKQAPASLMAKFKQRLANGDVHLHHHHAEFQPEETSHDHSHGHSHSHSHGEHGHHHHHDYQHLDHPLGPKTMSGDDVFK